MSTRIITDETMRETLSHGSADYPFCYYPEDLWDYDFHCVDWHWHSEVEFAVVMEGTVVVLAGSHRYELPAGTGFFINSQVIHRFETAGHAFTPNIVFSPSLLADQESLIYRKYIQPVLSASVDCQLFCADVPWQQRILQTLQAVFSEQEAASPSELRTVQLLLELWQSLYPHIQAPQNPGRFDSGIHTQAQLQIMLQYIHNHYHRQVTLSDIAAAVSLSKSSVLHLFQQQLHTSPIRYLIDYRLKRAAKLLVTTENSIASIAQSTGFDSAGYFCRKFRELFGQTPGQYRKSGREKPD